MNAFLALWTHRYRKATDMGRAYGRFWATWLWVKWLKLRTPRRKVIGILLAEHFGDIVACEPLLRYLRRQHPNDRLYWIVRPPFRELVAHHPDLNGTITEPNVLFSCLLHDNRVFDHLYFPYLSTRFYAYTGRRLVNSTADRLGITVFNYFDFGNLLTVFCRCANVPPLNEAPRVYIQPGDVARVDALSLPDAFVVVHCHSNYPPKDWQVAHWERLVGALIDHCGVEVVEIGLKSSLSVAHPGYHDLCGRLSLLQTAEVIRRGRFFVGVDSGPAHLANAVGTFGLVLLGRLNNLVDYMPYSGAYQTGENALLIRGGERPVSDLTFEDVWEPIRRTIAARSTGEPQPVTGGKTGR
jgi:heptosyltransferase-3